MFDSVPDEWRQVVLSDLVEIVTAGISADELALKPEVHHYSLPAFDLGCGPEVAPGDAIKSNKTLVPRDCILFSKLNPRIPRIWRVDGIASPESYCSTEFWPLVRRSTEVDLDFLTYLLGSPAFLSNPAIVPSSSTNSHQRVDRRSFESFALPLPPLDEQQRLAEVLRSVDEAIAATRAVAQQADVLWQAMTEALIWNLAEQGGECMRPLGAALRGSDYGVNVPLTLEEVGHPVLRMGNIQSGRIDLTNLKWGEVPAGEADALALSEGDILFNRTNSRDLVGKVALVREPTNCLYASYIVRLSVDRMVADPYYLFAAMHSHRAQNSFRAIATPGVSQSNINPTNLKKQLFPLPALASQQAIADQLRSAEEASFAAKQELAALQLIKRDLAQDLLSGRIRVPA